MKKSHVEEQAARKRAEYFQAYHAAHREERNAYNRAYSEANKEAIAEQKRTYRESRLDEEAAYQRAYREKHRDARAAYCRAYYAANREKLTAQKRVYSETHREERAALGALRRARKAGSPRVEKIDRAYVYERDGGKCHLCRKKAPRSRFHLDHLVPLSKGGTHTHDNLAVAHARCNISRHSGRLPAQLRLVG